MCARQRIFCRIFFGGRSKIFLLLLLLHFLLEPLRRIFLILPFMPFHIFFLKKSGKRRWAGGIEFHVPHFYPPPSKRGSFSPILHGPKNPPFSLLRNDGFPSLRKICKCPPPPPLSSLPTDSDGRTRFGMGREGGHSCPCSCRRGSPIKRRKKREENSLKKRGGSMLELLWRRAKKGKVVSAAAASKVEEWGELGRLRRCKKVGKTVLEGRLQIGTGVEGEGGDMQSRALPLSPFFESDGPIGRESFFFSVLEAKARTLSPSLPLFPFFNGAGEMYVWPGRKREKTQDLRRGAGASMRFAICHLKRRQSFLL